MSKITYTLTFFSDWHCGSGLAAGADVDALVVKDEDGLPFVPGKTIKGLVREQIELLSQVGVEIDASSINKIFGEEPNEDIEDRGNNKDNEEKKDKYRREAGLAFFGNAILSDEEHQALTDSQTQEFVYRSIANTAIDNNGIAKGNSLRKMQVVVPCSLHGEVLDIPEGLESYVVDAFKMVKRLGQGRNRGLGRCQFGNFVIDKED